MENTFVRALAAAVEARRNCEKHIPPRAEMADEWDSYIAWLIKRHAPSGAGFDSGTQFDKDKSDAARLVFTTSFHHMNEAGFYDGWTQHTVTLTAEFTGTNIRVSGRDRNQIKDYIADVFLNVASEIVPNLADFRAYTGRA